MPDPRPVSISAESSHVFVCYSHDDSSVVFAEINALQARGSANILSEPSIIAAQGQLAMLQIRPFVENSAASSNEQLLKLDSSLRSVAAEDVNLTQPTTSVQ